MNRNGFRRHTGAGSPIADMSFTTQNGTVVRSPMNGYNAGQGGQIALTRASELDPVTLTIPITNHGVGPFQYSSLVLYNLSNVSTSGLQLSSIPLAIAAGKTANLVITYTGIDEPDVRFSIEFTGSKNNTRHPFNISNIRVAVTTALE